MPAPRKVKGPAIPGAEVKPVIADEAKLKPYKQPKIDKNNPVAVAESYTRRFNGEPARESAAKKAARLKRLIEPISPSLIQVCSDIAHDRKVHPAVRLDAATRLLDRAYGKAKETIEISDPDAESGDAEVFKLLNNILESCGAPLLDPPAQANVGFGVSEEPNGQEK